MKFIRGDSTYIDPIGSKPGRFFSRVGCDGCSAIQFEGNDVSVPAALLLIHRFCRFFIDRLLVWSCNGAKRIRSANPLFGVA